MIKALLFSLVFPFQRGGHPAGSADGSQQLFGGGRQEADRLSNVSGREMQAVALCDRELGHSGRHRAAGAARAPGAPGEQPTLEDPWYHSGDGCHFLCRPRLAATLEVQPVPGIVVGHLNGAHSLSRSRD